MKFISLILAVYVLLLSAVPSFIEDKCMQEHTTEQGQNGQEDQNCNKGCCSPFFSCNTCTGFVLTTFHFSVTHSVKEPQRKLGTMPTPPVYNFPFSVWHPPQLV